MTEELTLWETTRLSKHFILLDFMADRAVYRSEKPLAFNDIWKENDEHDALARSLCNRFLEPLMEVWGPISIADAFWPSVFKSGHASPKKYGSKHRWTGGEATADIALYRLVDERITGAALKKTVEDVKTIDDCRDRIISYLMTEFLCVTFKAKGTKICGDPNTDKKKNTKAESPPCQSGLLFQPARFLPQWSGGRTRYRSGAEGRRKQRRARLQPGFGGSGGAVLCCRPGPAGQAGWPNFGGARDGDGRICRRRTCGPAPLGQGRPLAAGLCAAPRDGPRRGS